MLLTLTTLITYIGVLFIDDASEDAHRLVLTLPTLRLFFVLKTARRVVFAMVPLRTYIGSALALMLIIMYIYAILGVTIFEGQLERVGDPTHRIRVTCFDTIPSAMLTLAQILNGEAWYEVMYAVLNSQHSIYYFVYFVSFVLMETLMLTNLLVGVVLDSTLLFNMNEEETLQERVQHGDQIMELNELEGTYKQVMQERHTDDRSTGAFSGKVNLNSGTASPSCRETVPDEVSNGLFSPNVSFAHVSPSLQLTLKEPGCTFQRPSLLPQLTLKSMIDKANSCQLHTNSTPTPLQLHSYSTPTPLQLHSNSNSTPTPLQLHFFLCRTSRRHASGRIGLSPRHAGLGTSAGGSLL